MQRRQFLIGTSATLAVLGAGPLLNATAVKLFDIAESYFDGTRWVDFLKFEIDDQDWSKHVTYRLARGLNSPPIMQWKANQGTTLYWEALEPASHVIMPANEVLRIEVEPALLPATVKIGYYTRSYYSLATGSPDLSDIAYPHFTEEFTFHNGLLRSHTLAAAKT